MDIWKINAFLKKISVAINGFCELSWATRQMWRNISSRRNADSQQGSCWRPVSGSLFKRESAEQLGKICVWIFLTSKAGRPDHHAFLWHGMLHWASFLDLKDRRCFELSSRLIILKVSHLSSTDASPLSQSLNNVFPPWQTGSSASYLLTSNHMSTKRKQRTHWKPNETDLRAVHPLWG